MVHWRNEFLVEFKTMIQSDYGIKVRPIPIINPQANSILERVHQIIGNIIHIFKVQDMALDDKNPWDGILTSMMFELHTTVQITTQYTPAQLVIEQD